LQVIAVPVKSLDIAKRRLAGTLTPSERAVLTLAMMEDVLDACLVQRGWEVWVISRSEAVLEVAARRRTRPVAEREDGLLRAIRQVEQSMGGRWSRLAVVLADLPLLTGGTLAAALALGIGSAVVAAPAESDGGTNLLLRRPPAAMPARFGPSSFSRHRTEAERRKLTFRAARFPELAFDLDRPADLARMVADRHQTRTRSACLEMGLAERLAART
jgi:2-phospho-L-lactate guanylyltransferase